MDYRGAKVVSVTCLAFGYVAARKACSQPNPLNRYSRILVHMIRPCPGTKVRSGETRVSPAAFTVVDDVCMGFSDGPIMSVGTRGEARRTPCAGACRTTRGCVVHWEIVCLGREESLVGLGTLLTSNAGACYSALSFSLDETVRIPEAYPAAASDGSTPVDKKCANSTNRQI
jgi:hypothetical protein